MAEPKTKRTDASVDAFLAKVPGEERRRDCATVLALMKKITRQPPRMWGPSIVGFGTYRYRYASGHEREWPLAAFSPRKQDLTVYVMPDCERYRDLLRKLGKHKTGKSCLYLKRLADVDLKTLEEVMKRSLRDVKKAHGG